MAESFRMALGCLMLALLLGLSACAADVQVSAKGQSVTTLGMGTR